MIFDMDADEPTTYTKLLEQAFDAVNELYALLTHDRRWYRRHGKATGRKDRNGDRFVHDAPPWRLRRGKISLASLSASRIVAVNPAVKAR